MQAFGLAFILVVISPQMLFAQTSIGGGFGVPLVRSHKAAMSPVLLGPHWQC